MLFKHYGITFVAFFFLFALVSSQNLSTPELISFTQLSNNISFSQTPVSSGIGRPVGLAVAAAYDIQVIAVPFNNGTTSAINVFYGNNITGFTLVTVDEKDSSAILSGVSIVYAPRLQFFVIAWGESTVSKYDVKYATASLNAITDWTVTTIDSSDDTQNFGATDLSVAFNAETEEHHWALAYTLEDNGVASMIISFINSVGFSRPNFLAPTQLIDLGASCDLGIENNVTIKDISIDFYPGPNADNDSTSIPLAMAWVIGDVDELPNFNDYFALANVLNVSSSNCDTLLVDIDQDLEGVPITNQDNIAIAYSESEGPIVVYQDVANSSLLSCSVLNTSSRAVIDSRENGFYPEFQVVSNGEDFLVVFSFLPENGTFSTFFKSSTDGINWDTNATQISTSNSTASSSLENEFVYQGRIGLSLGPREYVAVVQDWTDTNYNALSIVPYVSEHQCISQDQTITYHMKKKCISQNEVYFVGDLHLASLGNLAAYPAIEDLYIINIQGAFIMDSSTTLELRFNDVGSFLEENGNSFQFQANSVQIDNAVCNVIFVNPTFGDDGSLSFSYQQISSILAIQGEWSEFNVQIETPSSRQVLRDVSNYIEDGEVIDERQTATGPVSCGTPGTNYEANNVTVDVSIAQSASACPGVSADGQDITEDDDDEDTELGLGLGLGLFSLLLVICIICLICFICILIIIVIIVIIVIIAVFVTGGTGAVTDMLSRKKDDKKDDKGKDADEPDAESVPPPESTEPGETDSLSTEERTEERSVPGAPYAGSEGGRSYSGSEPSRSYSRSYSGSERTDSRSYSKSYSGSDYSRSYSDGDRSQISPTQSDVGDSDGAETPVDNISDSRSDISASRSDGSRDISDEEKSGSYTPTESISDSYSGDSGSRSSRDDGSFYTGTSSGEVSGPDLTSEGEEDAAL